jgi:MFS transporter, SP family, sugar:H+ symporter
MWPLERKTTSARRASAGRPAPLDAPLLSSCQTPPTRPFQHISNTKKTSGIAGGVVSMPAFRQQFFPQTAADKAHPEAEVEAASPYCKHNDAVVSLFVSSLFLAGIVGALVASLTSRMFGRRNTMLAGGVAFALGAALMAASAHVAVLISGRMAMGLGVGLTTVAAPLFLSEMAPYKLRGTLNVLFQLAVAVGILIAQLINYGTQVREK